MADTLTDIISRARSSGILPPEPVYNEERFGDYFVLPEGLLSEKTEAELTKIARSYVGLAYQAGIKGAESRLEAALTVRMRGLVESRLSEKLVENLYNKPLDFSAVVVTFRPRSLMESEYLQALKTDGILKTSNFDYVQDPVRDCFSNMIFSAYESAYRSFFDVKRIPAR